MLDEIRERPQETLTALPDRRRALDPSFRTPAMVNVLSWLFLNPRRHPAGA